jgi:hypothetical protein
MCLLYGNAVEGVAMEFAMHVLVPCFLFSSQRDKAALKIFGGINGQVRLVY